MAGKQIDNLSINISANTGPLAQDLKKAARDIEQFGKTASRATRDAASLPVLRDRITSRTGGSVAAPGMVRSFDQFNRQKADAAAMARAESTRMRIAAGFDRTASWAGHTARAAGGSVLGAPRAVAAASYGLVRQGVEAGFDRVSATASAAAGSVTGFVKSVLPVAAGVATAEAGLTGLAGAFGQLRDSVRQAADYEMTALSFEVLLKDAAAAKTLLADIRKFAAETPFSNRELVDATRQLAAFGFAADRLIPTLRMLGDVSAAMGDRLPIGDAAYLYGTLRAQGRAYSRDILQFSQRGIAINEELASVLGRSTFEIASMVEEGRVGFRDVEQAFQRMTAEGGRFYGLTARQGQTTKASFEQLADAIDLTKQAFGQVLVEELDLRGASRDLQAFAARLRDSSGEIRPAVRFVGDLARGVAQLGFEFGRAGAMIASVNLSALERTFPGVKEAAAAFHQLIRDAKDFKFDDAALIDFAADTASMVVRTFAGIADVIAAAYRQAEAKAGPVLRTLERVNALIDATKLNHPTGPAPDRATLFPAAAMVDRSMLTGPAVPVGRRDGAPINRFAVEPPSPGMSADRIRAEWGALNDAVRYMTESVQRDREAVAAGRLQPGLLRTTEGHLADAHRRRFDYQSAFVGDPLDVQRWLDAGQVGPIRGGWGDPGMARGLATPRDSFMAGVGPAGLFEPKIRTFTDQAMGVIRELRDTLQEDARRRREERQQAEFRELARAAGLGPIAAVPPTVPDARALAVGQNRTAAWAGGVGGPLAAVAGVPDRTPEPRPEAQALGVDLRKQFDPSVELDAYRRDLDQVRLHQLAGPQSGPIADRAWMSKVGEVAGRFGLGGPAKLAPAAEVGSVEDARIVSAWKADAPAGGVEGLLMQLIRIAEQQLRATEGLPQAPPPRAVRLPGD